MVFAVMAGSPSVSQSTCLASVRLSRSRAGSARGRSRARLPFAGVVDTGLMVGSVKTLTSQNLSASCVRVRPSWLVFLPAATES